MDYLEAALAVLREEAGPLHWTVIQDRALRAGYLDPFSQRDIRRNLVAALARAARDGTLERTGTGVYRLPAGEDPR